jgi:chitinase
MTYGMDSSTKSTHHVPLYYNQPNALAAGCSIYDTVNYYIAEGGVAITQKLVVGAAFYGRKFTNTAGIGQAATRVSSPAYHIIKRDYIDKGFTEHWDDIAKVPYIHDVANNIVFTYESPRSIAEKSAYIKANNLGGMMVWQYGQDNSGTLIQAIYDTMK